PETVDDGVDDESAEHRYVGDDKGDRPGKLRPVQVARPERARADDGARPGGESLARARPGAVYDLGLRPAARRSDVACCRGGVHGQPLTPPIVRPAAMRRRKA